MPAPNLFKKKSIKTTPGFALGVVLGSEPVSGEIGIEIEVEGKNLPNQDWMTTHWRATHDGSLRGQESFEYVLAKPLKFDAVPEALSGLWKVFRAKKSVFDDSNRTSVHVHLNFQKFHLNRMASFCAMYFALEEVLTQWCGDHRVGNLFCLRAKDAPAIVSRIKRFIQADGDYRFGDSMKYSGLNPYALGKYGSMEVRTLRGCSEPDTILSWVGILRRLYEVSADFEDPRKVCELFSGRGPTGFFEEILGPMAGIVRSGVPFTEDEIQDSLYKGIRLSQDICYCRDWSLYQKIDIKDDPFGRTPDAKKKSLQAALNTLHTEYLESNGAFEELLQQTAATPQPTLAPPMTTTLQHQLHPNGIMAHAPMPGNPAAMQAIWTPDFNPFNTPDGPEEPTF